MQAFSNKEVSHKSNPKISLTNPLFVGLNCYRVSFYKITPTLQAKKIVQHDDLTKTDESLLKQELIFKIKPAPDGEGEEDTKMIPSTHSHETRRNCRIRTSSGQERRDMVPQLSTEVR